MARNNIEFLKKHYDYLIETQMQLPQKAIAELKEVLILEIGKDALDKLSEKEINHIGVMMLKLKAIQLKIHLRENRLKKEN